MKAYDLLVVGGGVQGLWVARYAMLAGMRVALVDAQTCGGGASGGPLGALMPHLPTGWSEKKQLQFDALAGLPELVRVLEAETGMDAGYARSGRIMPVRSKGFLDQFEARRAASWLHWQTPYERFEYALCARDAYDGWLDPEQAELGVLFDPLAARIDPVRYAAVLKAAIATGCDIFEGCRFTSYDRASGRVLCEGAGGAQLVSGAIVLAAGYETFDLVRGQTGLSLGGGVKGQAVVLGADVPASRPVLYDDGTYIIAHGGGRCAVGSTAEPEWTDARSIDNSMDEKLERARRLCPALREAPVIARWAGVRPKSAARDPIIGQLVPGEPVYIASGGFKITLAIAHLIAERLVDGIVEGRAPAGLPSSFAAERHVALAETR